MSLSWHDTTSPSSSLHEFGTLAASQNPDLSVECLSSVTANELTINRDVYSEIVRNHDILSVIFGFLVVDPTSAIDAVRERRRTLLNAALACEGLKEPALDALWSVLPSFMPLFRLLPSFALVNGIHVSYLTLQFDNYSTFIPDPRRYTRCGLGKI